MLYIMFQCFNSTYEFTVYMMVAYKNKHIDALSKLFLTCDEYLMQWSVLKYSSTEGTFLSDIF
jgi:hypothetical protein